MNTSVSLGSVRLITVFILQDFLKAYLKILEKVNEE